MRSLPLVSFGVALLAIVLGSCTTAAETVVGPVADRATTTVTGETGVATTVPGSTTTTAVAPPTTLSPFARPDWLGTRVLVEREDGFGEVVPTPPELVDRRFLTLDLLPAPDGEEFVATIGPIPDDVLARSTWKEDCPVTPEDLSYLTMTHYGFDGEFHTGEMIVNAAVDDDVVAVFRRLHEARFPIEQMRVIDEFELDLPPTGDWNDTTSFVCRPTVNSERWSQHAYGLAIDVNPFHNPYLKDGLVIPELASAYLDRDDTRPGMVFRDDLVVEAFSDIGWTWGGDWSTLKDWMHFSQTGN